MNTDDQREWQLEGVEARDLTAEQDRHAYGDVNPILLWNLRRLADEFGPLGVLRVASAMWPMAAETALRKPEVCPSPAEAGDVETSTPVGGRDDKLAPAELLSHMGVDAAKWAEHFVAIHGGDEGLMIGWFANAIEAGRSAGDGQFPACCRKHDIGGEHALVQEPLRGSSEKESESGPGFTRYGYSPGAFGEHR